MEKFRIGLYGVAQIMAICYGVLACGAAVKFNRSWLDEGYTMRPIYYHAMFYRDHGYWLLLLVFVWAAAMAYFSSQWADWKMDEDGISATGIVLTIVFALVGTIFAFGAAEPPPHFL